MFKRIVNNQALLNGLKQIKRSDNNDQNQIILAQPPSSSTTTTLTTINYGTPSQFATELEQFCTSIVPQDSAIFKIAKQICAEQGSRLQEIAFEVMKDSGLNNTNNNNNNNSNNTTTKKSEAINSSSNSNNSSNSNIVKTTTVSNQSSITFEQIEENKSTTTTTTIKPKRHDRFFGTNKMFLLGEDEIVNINNTTNTNSSSPHMYSSEDVNQTSQSLNLDIVKRLLVDIFGKLKNLVMVLLNNMFGNRQNQSNDTSVTTHVTAQSLVIVISFMIYNIVTVSSPVEMHQDILLVFQDFLSRHLQH